MARQYVALRNNPRLGITVEENATVGATIGTDLRLADGTIPNLEQLAVALGITVGQAQNIVDWAQLALLPPNIFALERTSGTGLFTITGPQAGAFRSVAAVAGQTTVSNGNGVAGNPTVGLADVTPGATASLLATTFDAKGRRDNERAADQADIDSALGYPAVESVVAGTNVSVDATDPRNPIVSASGGGGGGLLDLGSPATASGTDPIFDFGSP